MSKILLEKLVAKYDSDREHYLSSHYNETQLRADFLDPLFDLLGWDIRNTEGKPTNEREVLLEEGLKEDVASNTKKPDYTFRLFSERKFYLEAKKPNVKIETDTEPAKQIRRYGFTGKLKISVLSNFEYLAIYDCSEKVEESDSVSKSRIKIYHYKEYAEAFEEIQKELGRESVYSGAFDKTWEHIEERLKLFSVDSLFLNQINQWRLVLGKEIFSLRNDLNEAQLNDIVQRYINSIIFLRVLEDRNLEDYKTLLGIASADNFKDLVEKFNQADKKYNSGLFNHGLTEEIITNNSSAFWLIIKQLYYPESTYSFAVFASDILGNIYEIFLAQYLAIKDGEVTLEKKPDHIGRDVVTTPTYIIQDILRQTVREYCNQKTDKEILASKFADIACGSGAFLLETYQLVSDILIDYYIANSPEVLIQTGVSTYKLPFELKRKVLESCLFGIDKDFNAVEACKFGLLLKLLEDENNSSIPTPALPEISNVIHFGNSLVESSETTEASRSTINPFDFKDIKFDVVVGNPPYMTTEDMKELTPLELPLYKEKFSTAYKQFDKYFLFVEMAYRLLDENGYLGYIVPSKFTKVGSAKMLRELLKSNKAVSKLISFGANQIFEDKTTYTCLLIVQKKEHPSFEFLEVRDLLDWKTRNIKQEEFESVAFDELEEDWVLVAGKLKEVYERINSQSITLSELIGDENIYNGIQTSANDIYINTPKKEDKRYFYFQKDGKDWTIEKKLTKPYFKTSGGVDNLNTYRSLKANSFVIYPYEKTPTGEIQFIEISRLMTEFPKAYEYLSAYKDKLSASTRDIKPEPTTPDEWYRYGRHQSLDKCDVPAKIIVGVLSQGNKYAIDYSGALISSGGTAGYCMITLPSDCEYSIYYIQALLNSKYLEWYSALYGEVFRGGYVARGTKVLKKLPIRVIDFTNPSEKELHDEISHIEEGLIKTQEKIDQNLSNERELVPLQREFDSMKKELEISLKKLYGLGESDQKIPLISQIYETD
ncbi:MAG: Eco57I restriction-modification methylase domain-containing protein [Patescibacteria group bacterium]